MENAIKQCIWPLFQSCGQYTLGFEKKIVSMFDTAAGIQTGYKCFVEFSLKLL